MSQFAINLIWDPSVLSQPNAMQIEASLTSAAQVFASNYSNPITLNLHVGWGESDGQSLAANTLGESDPYLVNYAYSTVSHVLQGLPAAPSSSVQITDVQAAALGLSGASTVDAYIGFGSSPGNFTFSFGDSGNHILANIFNHEASEVMGRVSNAGNLRATPTVLDLFRYTAPHAQSWVAPGAAYFSRDGGITNEAEFNTDPTGDYGDWSTNVGSDAFDAFASSRVAGYFSQADQDVMSALGWAQTSPGWDGVFINSETQAWLGRAANSGDLSQFASQLDNGWTPTQIRSELLQYSEGLAHTDAQVAGLYQTYMGRTPTAAETAIWEGLVLGGDGFGDVRSAILTDPTGRAHTDATVKALYDTWFARDPTAAETAVWEGLVAGGDDFNAVRTALVNDPASARQVAANITGLYQTWFGRAPDVSELSVWTGLIQGGDDLNVLRAALIADPAGQAHLVQTVAGLYQQYLFRAPTSAEIGVWQGLLAGGESFSDVTAALVGVQQQVEASVPVLYQTYMGRAPTPAEQTYWNTQVVTAGATTAQVRAAIVGDPAGQAFIASGVTALYDTWFGRDPSPGELSVWQGLMAGGDTFNDVRSALVHDPAGQAYVTQQITAIFQNELSRPPTAPEINQWQSSLVAGTASFETVSETLALQYARANEPAPPSAFDINGLYQTYMGRAPSAAELAYWSSYDPYAGGSVVYPSQVIESSPEAQAYLTSQMTSLYETYIGRDPTASELAFWRTDINQGDDYAIARAALLKYPQGQAHTDQSITSLYDTFFQRDPTAGELAVWRGLVAGGDTFDTLRDALERDPGASPSVVSDVSFTAGQSVSFDSSKPAVVAQNFDPQVNAFIFQAAAFGGTNFLDSGHAREISAPGGGTDVLITVNTAHSVLIENTHLSQLSASNFRII